MHAFGIIENVPIVFNFTIHNLNSLNIVSCQMIEDFHFSATQFVYIGLSDLLCINNNNYGIRSSSEFPLTQKSVFFHSSHGGEFVKIARHKSNFV